MKTKTVVCATCGMPFEKELKEYNRRVRLGKIKLFCNEKCSGKEWSAKYDPFQFIFKSTQKSARHRPKEFDLTRDFIEALWNKQNGKCAYTQLQIFLPSPSKPAQVDTASLDRIDSSKGYVKDNVEFVSVFVNLGKNGFAKSDVENFLYNFRRCS